MGVPRALTLHESALNPQEWQTYTELFQELVEPPDTVLGVREARGYLKGRYSGLESGTVDKILRLFHPALAASDTLTQGQFFAVLRLLGHVTLGRPVDPALVFVQPGDNAPILSSTPRAEISNPHSAATTPGVHNSNNPFVSRTFSTSHPTNNDTPTTTTTTTNPFPSPSKAATSTHTKSTSTPNRPFSNSISTSALSSDEGSMPDYIAPNHTSRASSSPAPINMPNPFGVTRANSIPQSMVVPPAPVSSDPSPTNVEPKAIPPALPPRKPSFLPPPRHASQQALSVAGSSTRSVPTTSKEPPIKPPKPSHISQGSTSPFSPTSGKPANAATSKITVASLPGHITSPLIKQGLAAAKGAQRSAELGLDKLRTWEIIKSSSSPNSSTPTIGRGHSSDRDRSSDGGGDRERAASVSSGGGGGGGTVRIASTTRHVRNASHAFGAGPEHSRSPPPIPTKYPRDEDDDGPFATPTSPLDLSSTSASGTSSMGRRATLSDNAFVKADMEKQATQSDDAFSPITPSPVRVSRSKSLHSSSPSATPPVIPPRRKRPESVQVTGSAMTTPTAEHNSNTTAGAWFVPGKYVADSMRTNKGGDDEDGPFADDSSTAGGAGVDNPTWKPPPRGRSSMGYGFGSFTSEPTSSVGGGSGIASSNPMASLQRQFHNLQLKTRPGLESARAKVEGKLIPGGYGKWGAEGLTSDGVNGRRRVANTNKGVSGRRGSEGSDEFEDLESEDVIDTDDDVRRNGWKPLKG